MLPESGQHYVSYLVFMFLLISLSSYLETTFFYYTPSRFRWCVNHKDKHSKHILRSHFYWHNTNNVLMITIFVHNRSVSSRAEIRIFVHFRRLHTHARIHAHARTHTHACTHACTHPHAHTHARTRHIPTTRRRHQPWQFLSCILRSRIQLWILVSWLQWGWIERIPVTIEDKRKLIIDISIFGLSPSIPLLLLLAAGVCLRDNNSPDNSDIQPIHNVMVPKKQ